MISANTTTTRMWRACSRWGWCASTSPRRPTGIAHLPLFVHWSEIRMLLPPDKAHHDPIWPCADHKQPRFELLVAARNGPPERPSGFHDPALVHEWPLSVRPASFGMRHGVCRRVSPRGVLPRLVDSPQVRGHFSSMSTWRTRKRLRSHPRRASCWRCDQDNSHALVAKDPDKLDESPDDAPSARRGVDISSLENAPRGAAEEGGASSRAGEDQDFPQQDRRPRRTPTRRRLPVRGQPASSRRRLPAASTSSTSITRLAAILAAREEEP
jgi:hypothetical protein